MIAREAKKDNGLDAEGAVREISGNFYTKLKKRVLYEIIKKLRRILKEEIQCKLIQNFFQRHYYMNSILIKQKAFYKLLDYLK